PNGEGARPSRRDLHRHLIGGATDTARAHLEDGREHLDRVLERLDRVLTRLLAEDSERVIGDLLRPGLLAARHHLVDHLLDEPAVVDLVRLDRPGAYPSATWHQRALTPYWERAFLRSDTPAASSVPRTTL